MLDERLRDARDGVKTALIGAAPPPIDDLVWAAGRRTPPIVAQRGLLVAAASAAAVLLLIGAPILLVWLSNRGIEVSETTVPDTVTTVPETVTTIPETAPTTIAPLPGESPIAWIEPDWAQVESPDVFGGEGTQYIEAITVGGPGFVAVGGGCFGLCPQAEDDGWDAAVWVSEDAVDWTRIPHDEAVFGGPGDQDMIDVVSAGPGLVAVGIIDHAYFGGRRSPGEFRPAEYAAFYGEDFPFERDDLDAAVWTSVDGMSWSRVADPDGVFSGPGDGPAGDEAMEAVAVGDGLIVAVGSAHEDAAVWVSTDGLSWQRIPHDDLVFGGPSGQWMHDVTFTGERFVAVGTDLNRAEAEDGGRWRGAIWLSDDGYTWSRVPNDPAVFGGEIESDDIPSMNPFVIWSVTATDTGLIAAGTSPTHMALWTSADGTEWTRVFDEAAPFANPPTDIKVFPNTVQLRHAPVKALVGFENGVLAVGWDRDAAAMLTLSTDDYHFEHDLVIGQIYATEAKTDAVVADGRAIAVGYANGDAAIWIANIND